MRLYHKLIRFFSVQMLFHYVYLLRPISSDFFVVFVSFVVILQFRLIRVGATALMREHIRPREEGPHRGPVRQDAGA